MLVLPHFEIGGLDGGPRGEAQRVYDRYLQGCGEVPLRNGQTLHVNPDLGLGMCITGEGKVAAASCLTTLLCDPRLDLSDCLILAAGCAGGNIDYVAMGDVCLVSAAVDLDMGHLLDSSELEDPEHDSRWYPFADVEDASVVRADERLVDTAFLLLKDLELESSECAQRILRGAYPQRECSLRGPKVLKGSAVSSDNYWKGRCGHELALQKTAYYCCPDPYAVCEMEDVALLTVARQFGVLDRMLLLRAVLNTDEFLPGATPQLLWTDILLDPDLSGDSLGVFDIALDNLFKAEEILIRAALAGELF